MVDEAPGWSAIDAALQRVYPGVEPKHLGTIIGWRLGGPDPLSNPPRAQAGYPGPGAASRDPSAARPGPGPGEWAEVPAPEDLGFFLLCEARLA